MTSDAINSTDHPLNATRNGSCKCLEDVEGVEEIPSFKTFIVSVITILIVVNNIINLVILRKMKSINVRVKVLMASMSVSDLLLGVLVCVPGMVAAFIQVWPFSSALCQLTGIINGMSISVSMWSLTGITVERFFVIVQPIANHRPRLRHVRWGIAFIWVFNVTYYVVPVLMAHDMAYYVYQPAVLVCGFVWNPAWILYLSAALYPVGPGTIIVFCSYKIMATIRRNNLKIMDVTRVLSQNPGRASSSQTLNSCNEQNEHSTSPNTASIPMAQLQVPTISSTFRAVPQRQHPTTSLREAIMKRENKVPKVMVITASAFFSCSFPYLCSAVLEKQGVTLSSWHSFSVMWLLNCNSFINVFIYSAIYTEFRQLFTAHFLPRCLKPKEETSTSDRM